MEINQTENVPAKLFDGLSFIDKQDVSSSDDFYAYRVVCPEDYGIAIPRGTPVAPRFVNVNGDKLDPSTNVTLQKFTREGYPIADGIIFEETIGGFDYEEMRLEPEKMRRTKKALALDERESLRVLVDLPSGAADFDASASQLTIGEDTTNVGKPVSIKRQNDMSARERKALKKANGRNGGN